MTDIRAILRKMAYGAIPLATTFTLAPKPKAHALSLSLAVFTSIFSAVTANTASLTTSSVARAAMEALHMTTVFPIADTVNIQANGLSLINSYRPWMSSVYSANNGSAQLATSQALETQTLSGVNNTSPSTAGVGTAYTNTYGALPSASTTTTPAQQAVDMADATAQDGLKLGILADSAASQTITQANSLESQAMTTSSGSAPQLEATVLADQIQSEAYIHKLIAQMLRADAAKLGNDGVGIKSVSTTNSALPAALFGGSN